MGSEDVITAAAYALLSMLIPIGFGILLRRIEVLTKPSQKVLSSLNYYALIPVYALVFVIQAIDRNHLGDFGLLLFSSISSVIVGCVVLVAIAYFLRLDIRYRYSFSFALIYANVIVMPQMIGESACEKGGIYSETSACKQSLMKPYASTPKIYTSLVYWVTILPVLQHERRIARDIQKIFAVVLNYYDSIDHFLNDPALVQLRKLNLDETALKYALETAREPKYIDTPIQAIATVTPSMTWATSPTKVRDDITFRNRMSSQATPTAESGSTLSKEPLSLSSTKFINEYYQRTISKAEYQRIREVFERFETALSVNPDQAKDRAIITQAVLEPAGLLKTPEEEQVLSWKFLKQRVFKSPPAICSVLGLILGFIFPFKEWLFDPNNKPLPILLSTLQTFGSMMSPVSLILLGAAIAEGAHIRPDTFLRWKHVIMANIVRNAIFPIIGLVWVFVILKAIDSETFKRNPLIMLTNYTYWIVPNGIILISVYVFADYFILEFGILSFYINLIAVPMMAFFLVVYFSLYEGS